MPLTIEAAPGEHPIIDLSESENWQQDPNGYWYVDPPANSIIQFGGQSPKVEIRNGAAATEILGDPVNGGPPTAFTQPDSTYYQNGQLAFDLTWYNTATHRLWFRSNEIDPITNPNAQCGVVAPSYSSIGTYGASWLVIEGLQIQNGFMGIHLISGDHETVENCRVTNMWEQGIMLSTSSYDEISNNYVDAVGGQLTVKNGTIERDWLFHDLYVTGQGNLIDGNFLGRAWDGDALSLTLPTNATATTVVVNNVCYGSQAASFTFMGSDIVVTGNVFISPTLLWRGSPPASSLTDAAHSGIYVFLPQDSTNVVISGNYIEGAYVGVEDSSFSTSFAGQTVPGWVLSSNTIVSGESDTAFDMLPAEMGSNQWGGGLRFNIPGRGNINYKAFLAWVQSHGYGSLSAAMATAIIDPSGYDGSSMPAFRSHRPWRSSAPTPRRRSTASQVFPWLPRRLRWAVGTTPDVKGTSFQANNEAYSLEAGATLVVDAAHGVLANDLDADQQSLTAAPVSEPAHGQLTFNSDGSFSYTPDANVSGQAYTDQFTYMATDGNGGTAMATVTLNILLLEDPTVNVTDAGGTYNGTPFPATATLTTPGNTPVASLGGISPTLAYYVGSLTTAQLATATALPGAPSTAGPYTVVATFPGNTEYAAASSNPLSFTITKATPTIAWATPAAITYGTALDSTQLDATANVQGSFTYAPAAGTVLGAGSQTLSATFTPADTADYSAATASVSLVVNKATPTITWATPAAITYGTALDSTQLDATANVQGSFTYAPAAGTVLGGAARRSRQPSPPRTRPTTARPRPVSRWW